MCVIALKLANSTISDDIIRSCWISNSDGGGFALSTEKKIVVKKGIMYLKDFIAEYRAAEKKLKNPVALLHFRIRSSGDKSPENTHPFPVADGGVMAHNGTLNAWADYSKKESDTLLFAQDYAKDFTFALVDKIKDDLGDAIGYYNKLAFLWKGKRFSIVNEKAGTWEDGIWFSNHSWKFANRRQSNYGPSNLASSPGAEENYLARAFGVDDF